MAPPRAQSLLAAAVTVAVACRLSTATAGNCGLPGCTFTGGCRRSTSVTCDFQHDSGKQIDSQMRSLPPSIRAITISNAKRLELKKNSIEYLTKLESIHLMNINNMELLENSMTLGKQQQAISLTIEHVMNLHLRSNAFSEWQNHDNQITIRNIEDCHIQWSAFSTNSKIPKVSLVNISSLTVEKGAFKANITHLTVENALMPTCDFNAFGGRIETLTLQSVEIKALNTGCVMADGWKSLTLISCRLHDIMPSVFQGTVDHVLIETTTIGHVQEKGFNMTVSTFSVMASEFGELSADALNVLADGSISLRQNNVTTLRSNAFRRLRIRDQNGKMFNISQLFVSHADNGSLRFEKGVDVILHKLFFRVSCVCDIEQRAQQLVFGAERVPANIAREERKLLQPIYESRCMHESRTPTLAEFNQQQCSSEEGGTTKPRAAEEEEEDEVPASDGTNDRRSGTALGGGLRWTTYVAIAAAILLFLLCGTALLIFRRRNGAGSCGRHSSKGSPDGASRAKKPPTSPESDDTAEEEEYAYCEVFPPTVHAPEGGTAVFNYGAAGGGTTDKRLDQRGQPSTDMEDEEEEPLYEEIFGDGYPEIHPESPQTGMMAGLVTCSDVSKRTPTITTGRCHQSGSSVNPPVYAEVSKKKSTSKNSGTNHQDTSVDGFPIYTQVVKVKKTTENQETGHETGPSEDVPVYAEVSKKKPSFGVPDTNQSASGKDFPLYAEISKDKSITKNPGTIKRTVLPNEEFPLYAGVSNDKLITKSRITDHQDASHGVELPLYAEVSKDRSVTKGPGTGHRAALPTEAAPLYAEVSRGKPVDAPKNGKSHLPEPTTCNLICPGISKGDLTTTNTREEHLTAPTKDSLYAEVPPAEEFPLYAEVAADIEMKAEYQTDEDLLDNPLYGSTM